MRFYRKNSCKCGKPACAGFTLAEVLAALVFMALVIPASVEGIRIANLAGQVTQRKAEAVRLAESVLNEMIVMQTMAGLGQGRTVQRGVHRYEVTISVEPWLDGGLRLATAQVQFSVQGRPFEVSLSTLLKEDSGQ